jgi:hypothetical protein
VVLDPSLAEHADQDPREQIAVKGIIDIFGKGARLVGGEKVIPMRTADERGEVVEAIPITGDHTIAERPAPGDLDRDEPRGGEFLHDVGWEPINRHAGRIGMDLLLLDRAFDHIQKIVSGLRR